MKKNKRKWNKEINEGIKEFENRMNNTYNYYGQIGQRDKIKRGKNYRHYIIMLIRLFLGITLITYTILHLLDRL